MTMSIFEIFSIGIGPSSSHTVGPMRAAYDFLKRVKKITEVSGIGKLKIELYGSLATTGVGHGTDKAVLIGLEGGKPETIDPVQINAKVARICKEKTLKVCGRNEISFDMETDLIFYKNECLEYHNNGMRFSAFDLNSNLIFKREYYSIGGGEIKDKETILQNQAGKKRKKYPYEFSRSQDLFKIVVEKGCAIQEVILANELSAHTREEVENYIIRIWGIMRECVIRGCGAEGVLPGGLNVRRRAPELYDILTNSHSHADPTEVMDWVSLYALAVSEENAAGGRVVTAPTNGSAGVIPAVLHYFQKYYHTLSIKDLLVFFLTATAIGGLCKEGASISGAEVGCQGEIGVASAMAAAGLTALLGGSNPQIENAAEIALEHHLGLTCDPVKGLVQIPCIERNTMGAIKAINAARLAMRNKGSHIVTLDKVIATLKKTGEDMNNAYKESGCAGLAVD